jgi:hypothetical protein
VVVNLLEEASNLSVEELLTTHHLEGGRHRWIQPTDQVGPFLRFHRLRVEMSCSWQVLNGLNHSYLVEQNVNHWRNRLAESLGLLLVFGVVFSFCVCWSLELEIAEHEKASEDFRLFWMNWQRIFVCGLMVWISIWIWERERNFVLGVDNAVSDDGRDERDFNYEIGDCCEDEFQARLLRFQTRLLKNTNYNIKNITL